MTSQNATQGRQGTSHPVIGLETACKGANRNTRPSASLSIDSKATRLLATGAVWVSLAGPEGVAALVDGDTAQHLVTWTERDSWACDCTAWAYRATCSHQTAVELVTTRTRWR